VDSEGGYISGGVGLLVSDGSLSVEQMQIAPV
jgi:hypothetical protein